MLALPGRQHGRPYDGGRPRSAQRTGDLTIVNDYKGVMNVNWFDGGTHVFHDGPVHVDEEGVAHFAP